LTKGRISGGQTFHGGQCNVTPTSLEHCSRSPAVSLSPLLIFWGRKLTPVAFQWTEQLTKVAPSPPVGDLNLHLTHGSLGPLESAVQSTSRLVQQFLQGSSVCSKHRHMGRWTDRETDRQKHSQRYVRHL